MAVTLLLLVYYTSSLFITLLLSADMAIAKVVRSWASKKFMTGCVILLPMAITFYITWGFINFVDGLFSPIYSNLEINIFGPGFVTSITFIFLVGVFMSSWLGASALTLGELFIKKMPLVSYIYAASKQISEAISPEFVISGGMSIPQLQTTANSQPIPEARLANLAALKV